MLTKTITRLWPKLGARNIYRLGLHLELKDGTDVVIDQDVTVGYSDGQSVVPVKKDLKLKAQDLIDTYKAEKLLNTKAGYVNAITEIDSVLDITE